MTLPVSAADATTQRPVDSWGWCQCPRPVGEGLKDPLRGPWSRSHTWLSAFLSKASHSHIKRNHPHGSADTLALSISGSCWPLPFSSTVMLALVTPPYLHASRLPAVPADYPSTSQWKLVGMSVSGSHPKSLQ